MATLSAGPTDVVRERIEQVAGDLTLSASERQARLELIREDLISLQGRADSYISELIKFTEAEEEGEDLVVEAQVNADIREELLERRLATPEECDAIGLLPADELEHLAEEGLLEEALPAIVSRLEAEIEATGDDLVLQEAAWGLAANFREFLVLRSRSGQFRSKDGRVKLGMRHRGRSDVPVAAGKGGVDHSRYFQGQHDKIVSLDKLTHVKAAQPKSTANAKEYMHRAAGGEMGKRQPVTVRQTKKGYVVVDGNATVRAARELGWEDIPVKVVGGEKLDLAAALKLLADTTSDERIKPKQPQSISDPAELFPAVEKGMPEFTALVGQATKDVGLPMTTYERVDENGGGFLGPLKKMERAQEKVDEDYGGDWTKLNDIGRATIVTPDAYELADTMDAVISRANALGWDVTNVKDRFTSGASKNSKGATSEGYMDLSMLLRSPEGLNFELLLTTAPLFEAKEKKGGHKLYDVTRKLEIERTKRPLTPEELTGWAEASSEARDLYAEAATKSLTPRLTEDPEAKAAEFAKKRTELDKQATKKAKEAVKKEGKGRQDPGSTPNNPSFGKTTQHTLLRYVKEAATEPSTQDRYSKVVDGKRVYDESRKKLHDRIVDTMLRKPKNIGTADDPIWVPDPEGDYYPSQKVPSVLFSGGGYAAGKGGVIKKLAADGRVPENAMKLDPDVIKSLIPEFADNLGTDPQANLMCHDDRTQTLTEHGWLGLEEIRTRWDAGERFKIGAFDMGTGLTKMETPSALHIYPYEGDLYHFQHQSLDLAVTPNHRMVTQRRHRSDWEVVEAQDLTYHADGRTAAYVPLVAQMEGRREETFVLAESWKYPERARVEEAGHRHRRIALALAAGTPHKEVALAEGCGVGLVEQVSMGRHKTIRTRNRARWPERRLAMDGFLGYLGWWLAEGDKTGGVCQSMRSPFLEECQAACWNSGMEGSEYISERPTGAMWYWHPTGPARQLREWLEQNAGVGAYQKRVPAFVFDLSVEQRMIVLRGMVNGDGACGTRPWDGARSASFGSASSLLADGAQRLAVSCGLRASKRRRRSGMWNVQMSRPKTTRRRLPSPTLRRFGGEVYCFTTPSSTMVTRRNGYVAITGNSYAEAWDISQEVQRKAQERKLNVIVDGISNTSADEMLGRVRSFADAGYGQKHVVYVTIPTEEAVSRAWERAVNAKDDSDKRFIPEVIMRAVHRDVSATVPGVIQGAKDAGLTVEVWENHQGQDENGKFRPPVPIFKGLGESDDGILDQKLWEEFLDKARERIPGVDR